MGMVAGSSLLVNCYLKKNFTRKGISSLHGFVEIALFKARSSLHDSVEIVLFKGRSSLHGPVEIALFK